MEKLTVDEIINAVSGILISGTNDISINHISTDSRDITPGCMFIPLIGDEFDGHDFIGSSIQKGAKVVFTQKDVENSYQDVAIIKVDDTLDAYHKLAKYYRLKFNIPFIAVTGSVGKTTTKDMIACVLEKKYKVTKTKGNFNNLIGVPKVIFDVDNNTDICVNEMGMNRFNEIDTLSNMVMPNTAIITNIGVSHIGNLGSRENILTAKLEIINGMSDDSQLILNGDDDLLSKVHDLHIKNVYYYSIASVLGLYAYDIREDNDFTIYTVDVNNIPYEVKIPALGKHNIYNSLAAIQIGIIYNVPINDVLDGLMGFVSGKMRQRIVENNGIKIIEDCYNASPASMKAGINVLKQLEGTRKIAILGDMLELGDFSEQYHSEIGEYAATNGIDGMFLYGDYKECYRKGAVNAGLNSSKVLMFNEKNELILKLKQFIEKDDVILIKGSRGMHMEEIFEALM